MASKRWILKPGLSSLGNCPPPVLSILKEINPQYSLEGLKLKLQYFGHLM